MRLAVFGATGRTGRLAAEAAVARSHEVVAAVRSRPDEPFDGSVRVEVIDLRGRAGVGTLLAGVDAVVWAIGPVAGITVTEVSDALRSLVEAMGDAGIRRMVVAANATVLTEEEVIGEYSNVTEEHRRNAATLEGSDLDWTILAPPFLKDDPPTGQVDTVIDAKAPGCSLTRGDFAIALVDAIDRPDWVRHIVGITNR